MHLYVYQNSTKKLIATGAVKNSKWFFLGKQKLSVLPDEYVVDMYAEPTEDDPDIEQWEPVEQTNILVSEILDRPQMAWGLPTELSQYRLVRRIKFQVLNDSLFSRVLRWKFASKQKLTASSWHIPIHVKVSQKKLFQITISLSLVQLLNQVYEMGIVAFSGRIPPSPWFWWLLAVAVTTVLFAVFIYAALSFLLSTVWHDQE